MDRLLELIAVRVLQIASECTETKTRKELFELADTIRSQGKVD